MENLKNTPIDELEQENYHDNVYEILYIDDINKEKIKLKQKQVKEEQKKLKAKQTNKKVNKILNISIIIALIGIIIVTINIVFAEKINELKAPIEAYFINKQIEKEVLEGNMKPASEYEEEVQTDVNWIEENSDQELIEKEDTLIKKESSFEIDDKIIYNFNEEVPLKIPDEAYVQSTNKEKVLMLNSEKIYDINLKCNAYEVKEQNGRYYLIIHSDITNVNYPGKISLQGIISASINNQIVNSNKSNIEIEEGKTNKIDIFTSLTEEQYKLIRNEINNITFIYKDDYNYREIFATYGGNYLK